MSSDADQMQLHELRVAIQAGADSGPGVDADQVLNRLKDKYHAAASSEISPKKGSTPFAKPRGRRR